jgi:hypothetical protein
MAINFENTTAKEEVIAVKEGSEIEKIDSAAADLVRDKMDKDLAEQKNNQLLVDAGAMDNVQKQIKSIIETAESTKKSIDQEVSLEPKTAAEKRLVEKVGYDMEVLAQMKQEFSQLSSAEAYNKFQEELLETMDSFLINTNKANPGAIDAKELGLLINKIRSVQDAEPKGAARRSFSSVMNIVNRGADGSVVFGGLGKTLAKNGYDNRNALARTFGSSAVAFENFQKDLAEQVLSPQQQEEILAMAKLADETPAEAGHAGGVESAKVMADKFFSAKKVEEIAPVEKLQEAA